MAKSVKISNELWDRIREVAALAGYSSPEEFVAHILEQQVAALDEAQTKEEVMNRLRGLGYID